MDKLLLRPVEAAAALGVGRNKVYELMASGALPSLWIGRGRRIPATALDSWIASQVGARQPRQGEAA